MFFLRVHTAGILMSSGADRDSPADTCDKRAFKFATIIFSELRTSDRISVVLFAASTASLPLNGAAPWDGVRNAPPRLRRPHWALRAVRRDLRAASQGVSNSPVADKRTALFLWAGTLHLEFSKKQFARGRASSCERAIWPPTSRFDRSQM